MNTHMWDHPFTSSHIATLTKIGYVQVPPVSKLLACGDQGRFIIRGGASETSYLSAVGMGAMATVDNIIKSVINC